MPKIRLALVGCGHISRMHLTAWQAVAGAEVVALCDLDADRAAARGREFGISQVYTEVDRLLADVEVDAVDVATPPDAHVAVVEAAASAGKHIICQKPLALTVADGRGMVETCHRAGVRLMVNENWRWRPWFRRVKALLEDGRIGDPIYCHLWRRQAATVRDPLVPSAYALERRPYFRTMPGLIVLEQGVHYVDVFRFLLGPATRVYGLCRRISDAVAGEDLATILLETDRVVGDIQISWCSRGYAYPTREARVVVEGTLGTVAVDEHGGITVQAGARPPWVEFTPENDGYLESFVATHTHFATHLIRSEPFETEGRAYLHTLAVAEAALRSGREGRAIEVSG